jgi:hypothetical protein
MPLIPRESPQTCADEESAPSRNRTSEEPRKIKASEGVTHEEPHAPDLLGQEIFEIVSAWPRLPKMLRAAILAILAGWRRDMVKGGTAGASASGNG